MEKIELKAMGKINLGLDILGKRKNGYHDVRMVMQTVYLYDGVTIEKQRGPGIEIETNLFFLPVDENNLAYRAAKLLMDEYGIQEGIRIVLDKRIPVSAGMAGGSADAAAVLFGMNQLFGLGLGDAALRAQGMKLGADVPYCIMRGTYLAEGIGEVLTELPQCPRCHVLLAKPSVNVSTRTVYEKFDRLDDVCHPDIDGIIRGLKRHDLKNTAKAMGNVLEQVTAKEYPIIEEIKRTMLAGGALNAMMSGSGPTVFGIFEEKTRAKEVYKRIKEQRLAKQVYVTTMHHVRRK